MKALGTGILSVVCILLTIVGCKDTVKAVKDDKPRRIEVMFLGHDQEHHNSRAYMPKLASALTLSGINITYSEDLDDLNTSTLSLYDALIIYANHEKISPAQENALFNFVDQGNALIPIHAASACFKNSPKYIEMVGGQFKSHGTDTFTAKVVDSTHASMAMFEEFSTWDETYVHHKFSDDITVLMEREEGEHREPWTWVKNVGKGKVFYTAYGHDERTWSHPGFHDLIKGGIRWSVNQRVKKNWEAFSKTIPTLAYTVKPNIPNYEKRDPEPKYQLPLSPEESAKLIQVPSGFNLELFASEPDIINPIAMNWDEKGRLWVVETVDYPNTVRDDKGVGDDRIKICEDTDGDGKADKFTVFADQLNIPTSFVFVDGGIIVSQAPNFLFLKDEDGDDKADLKEVIINGWGVFDTHAGPSNLQMGIDNKIYGVVGYSGFKGTIAGQNHEFSQGIYRFNKDVTNFEFLTNTSNNTWGLGITEDNAIFASTANNTHSVFMGIPNKYYVGVEGIPAQGSMKIDGHYDMRPITPNIRQVDVFGGFTAAAGHHFYSARLYPKSFWNTTAFVCEPTGGLVHMSKIVKDGAGYIEQDGGNLMASSDEWVSPVEAKVGPDGAVWVLDWYNFIIQHNPTPRLERGGFDAENGKGNAYINPLRDKLRGRVWRIVPKGATHGDAPDLAGDNPKEWVKSLSNDNLFWRQTAQRLIVDLGNKDVLPGLYELVQQHTVDGQGLNPGALHALWTIQGLENGAFENESLTVLKNALYHPSGAVRKAALQMLPRTLEMNEAVVTAGVLNDIDPSVQMAALLYVSETDPTEKIGKQLYDLSTKKEIKEDRWLSTAVYLAANSHSKGFIKEYVQTNPNYKETTPGKIQYESASLDDTDWDSMELPQYMETGGLDLDGVVWFRKKFSLSNNTGKAASVSLGPIDDSDIVYINGIKVGGMEQSYDKDRVYTIPAGILVDGPNVIAVRVEDTGAGGGIYGNSNQMFIRAGTQNIPLAGSWNYKVEKDFSNRVKNIFDGTSIGALFMKNYKGKDALSEIDAFAGEENAVVIQMGTIKNEMKYDLTEFVVEAGRPVELIFENTDFMQHNLIITQPGMKEKVGLAADKLATDPQGAAKNYIPEIPEVLFATAIVNPEEKVVLRFTAPKTPGDYPYICTFPGHWRIMQGVMKVVPAK